MQPLIQSPSVASGLPLPNIQEHHTLAVNDIEKPNKVVSTKYKGQCDKYIIHFIYGGMESGYKPELLLPVGTPLPIEIGQAVRFRVGYRNERGDEIDLVAVNGHTPNNGQVVNGQAKPPVNGESLPAARIVNMNGHPAVYALSKAVEICCKRADSFGGGEDTISDEAIIKTSEKLLKWLKEKGLE